MDAPVVSPREQRAGGGGKVSSGIWGCYKSVQIEISLTASVCLSLSASPTTSVPSGLSFHSQHGLFVRLLGEVGREF